MINGIKHIVFGVLILLSVGELHSQSYISDRMAREVNLNALKQIEKYENSFYFSRGSDYEMFTSLFTSGKAMVFNDIMPDNNLDSMVTVNNYLDIFQTYYYKRLNVSINPYGITPIASTNGNTGTLSVYAYKIISGKTLNKFNYIDTFDIVFDIKFNYKDTVYKINEIRANHKYGKYCIIDASVGKKGKSRKIMEGDSLLINDKTVIHLDKNGNYILKRVSDDHPIEVKPFNEDLMGSYIINENFINNNKSCKKSGDKNIRCISFKYPKLSIGFAAGYAAFNNPVVFNKETDGVVLNKQPSYYTGINFGYILSNKARLSFKTGIYYKSLAFGLQKDYYANSYTATDPDGSNYTRIDSTVNINENVKLNYLNIPFFFQKQFKLSRIFFVNVDLGVTVYYNLSAEYNSTAEGIYGGIYPDLFNVYISEEGFYDFGNYDISNKTTELQTNKLLFTVYAAINAGMRLNQKTEVFCGVGYNRSFSELFEITTEDLSSNSQKLNSLTSVSGEYYINETMINAGINFKF